MVLCDCGRPFRHRGKHLVPAEQRFWAHVVKTEGCWVWTGAKTVGYGIFRVAGHNVRAPRYSWALAFGPIPDGMDVLHKCDNPPCVRPDHLFLGGDQANRDDQMAKGRYPLGDAHRNTIISDAQVIEIRHLYAQGGLSQQKIAEVYGVSRTTIQGVVNGRRAKTHGPISPRRC